MEQKPARVRPLWNCLTYRCRLSLQCRFTMTRLREFQQGPDRQAARRRQGKMNDLRKLLGRVVTVARAALLRHVEKITVQPDGKAIVAAGIGNYSGKRPGDGAGGPNRNGRVFAFSASLAA